MAITASKLRQDIFKILDQVIETGIPVEIIRNNEKLLIIPAQKKSKLNNLRKRAISKEPLESFDHIDWSKEWKG